jgi:hypothetical protein
MTVTIIVTVVAVGTLIGGLVELGWHQRRRKRVQAPRGDDRRR